MFRLLAREAILAMIIGGAVIVSALYSNDVSAYRSAVGRQERAAQAAQIKDLAGQVAALVQSQNRLISQLQLSRVSGRRR